MSCEFLLCISARASQSQLRAVLPFLSREASDSSICVKMFCSYLVLYGSVSTAAERGGSA